MLILFGTRTKEKRLCTEGALRCSHCGNVTNWEVIKATDWFTLFFVPVIPMSSRYYEVCPICHMANPISKADSEQLCQQFGRE